MYRVNAYAARSPNQPLKQYRINRRTPGSRDVQIEILYCGVCHTDLHYIRDEWQSTVYPVVPGHEIIGSVTKVGRLVSTFRQGDLVGVGPLVGSCRHCDSCLEGLEQYCENGTTQVFNDREKTGEPTYGGYSESIVVPEHFVLTIPSKLNPAKATPLLCAGITMYSPLSYWNIGRGHKVGIVGLGGLGHLGVKFAKEKGARVTVFTTSRGKLSDAKRIGADEAVLSTDAAAMQKQGSHLDFIINTIPESHDVNPYVELLKRDGVMVTLGVFEPLEPGLDNSLIASWRRSLSGSVIGGIRETQEMIDYCASHNLTAEVEVIPIQKINEAFERMLKRDVKYRFVIDMTSLK